jgi:two-component system KDP operon response regulator KdpE
VPWGSIRVLIVDDDAHFLDAVEALLERAQGFEIVGRAMDGGEALRRTAELMPDAITMDIDMPVVDGVEATRMITAYFDVPVVLLSSSDWGERVEEGLAGGAVAHVFKSKAWDELVPTLRAAVRQRPKQ